jgi:hypothetical protein
LVQFEKIAGSEVGWLALEKEWIVDAAGAFTSWPRRRSEGSGANVVTVPHEQRNCECGEWKTGTYDRVQHLPETHGC